MIWKANQVQLCLQLHSLSAKPVNEPLVQRGEKDREKSAFSWLFHSFPRWPNKTATITGCQLSSLWTTKTLGNQKQRHSLLEGRLRERRKNKLHHHWFISVAYTYPAYRPYLGCSTVGYSYSSDTARGEGDRRAVFIWFLFLRNCYLHHARTLVPAYQLLLSCEINPLNKEKYSVSFTPVKSENISYDHQYQ